MSTCVSSPSMEDIWHTAGVYACRKMEENRGRGKTRCRQWKYFINLKGIPESLHAQLSRRPWSAGKRSHQSFCAGWRVKGNGQGRSKPRGSGRGGGEGG